MWVAIPMVRVSLVNIVIEPSFFGIELPGMCVCVSVRGCVIVDHSYGALVLFHRIVCVCVCVCQPLCLCVCVCVCVMEPLFFAIELHKMCVCVYINTCMGCLCASVCVSVCVCVCVCVLWSPCTLPLSCPGYGCVCCVHKCIYGLRVHMLVRGCVVVDHRYVVLGFCHRVAWGVRV